MLIWLMLVACSDGYPTEDVPQLDPAAMTKPQLLDALNELGQSALHSRRWRYVLREACELDITVRGEERQRHRVALHHMAVMSRSADGTTELLLVPHGGDVTDAITAIETRRWPDTIRARALFTRLQARCRGQGSAPS